jgi:hypothetical protein
MDAGTDRGGVTGITKSRLPFTEIAGSRFNRLLGVTHCVGRAGIRSVPKIQQKLLDIKGGITNAT